MSEYLWHCPFCNTEQAVANEGRHAAFADLTIENAAGPRRLVVKYAVCPNPACREFSLSASLHSLEVNGNRSYTGKHLKTWPLIPPSRARSFPVAIPSLILQDYQEACLTLELSPKVSAALSRRCLSSMLRDFWQVQPGSLSDEFRQARSAMDPLTWEAVEAVKKSGLIGARMEREGAEISETEPGEAQMLIDLIETLIQDWYVTRAERKKRLEKIKRATGEGIAKGEAGEPAPELKDHEQA